MIGLLYRDEAYALISIIDRMYQTTSQITVHYKLKSWPYTGDSHETEEYDGLKNTLE